jgi:hypothetical protein
MPNSCNLTTVGGVPVLVRVGFLGVFRKFSQRNGPRPGLFLQSDHGFLPGKKTKEVLRG